MSERTDRMLGQLTPWESEDPNVIAIMESVGGEYDLIETFMTLVRDQAWPHRADDTYGLLSLHERTLGLAVAPEGLTIEQRQQAVKVKFKLRKDGRKVTWSDRIADLVGPGNFTYTQHSPGANQITVALNVLPSSGLATSVARQVEEFTPVAKELIVTYAGSFFLGESELGEDEL